MKRSTDRILTTHAGSLPRPEDLKRMMWDKIDGKPVDESRLQTRVREAVAEIVAKQDRIGIDIVSDGEMSKPGFSNYVIERYSGFTHNRTNFERLDMKDAPEVARRIMETDAGRHVLFTEVVGPVALRDRAAIQCDLNNFKAALGERDPDQAFVPAVTPGQITFNFVNRYYPSFEKYLWAIAEALEPEYKIIVDAGFNLQLDSPDLAMRGHCISNNIGGPADQKKYLPMLIEALNHATREIPPEKMRLHLCWGNYPGPHHKDVELSELVEPVLKTRAAFIYPEAANPRHAHEWEVWREIKLPEGKALIPGVIDTATNHVEHPRLVAQRIERFASLVGRENVIAGTDCGFATFVGWSGVDPAVAWLKLEALVQGAQIASENLW